MKSLRPITNSSKIKFEMVGYQDETKERLVAVWAIDSLRMAADGFAAIRMPAYANREAIDLIFATGRATFYSRSRQRLWTKGEDSSNFLLLRAMYADCDTDAIIYDIEPMGPTCHKEGAESCFQVADEEL